MTRKDIEGALRVIFVERFEIPELGLDEDLREKHMFDSIDAIELLQAIEDMLDDSLNQEEKKSAMDIRTLAQIIDFVAAAQDARS